MSSWQKNLPGKHRPNYAGSIYLVIWMSGAKFSRPGIIKEPEYWRLSRPRNSRHTYSTLLRSVGTEFKVMQELLRHSSLRSTLDVYTQAISPAKHAAQAAVLALVLASETNSSALA